MMYTEIMGSSEAHLRAVKKYNEKGRKRLGIDFYEPDFDLYEWCRVQGATKLKQILREAMKDEQK